MRHYIIQMGSGQPGEMGTGETEKRVFQALGLKNARVLFCPFHHLDLKSPTNDWALFQKLCAPMIDGNLELVQFHHENSMRTLREKMESADLIILGSGLCEPYLAFMKQNRLDETLKRAFRRKKISLLGYSAGSIALSHAYTHVLFFEEIFGFYNQALASGATSDQLDEMRMGMLRECSMEDRPVLQKLLATGEPLPAEHPIARKIFQSRCVPALNLLPEQVVLPHYRQSPYALSRHLENSAKQMPWLKHYGIPNGVALVHTYEDSGHVETRILGQNPLPELTLTRHFPSYTETYQDGQRIA